MWGFGICMNEEGNYREGMGMRGVRRGSVMVMEDIYKYIHIYIF